MGRYLPAAGNDRHLALRIYVWNARLCEEFYIPSQIAEVCFRNVLSRGLTIRYGNNWHRTPSFVANLPRRLQDELAKVEADETAKHGAAMTADHMVSALSFGFWVHLTSATPVNLVWRGSLPRLFPNLPGNTDPRVIHTAVDNLRKFRNRIAHHNAIFDKGPVAEYKNIQDIISWVCADTLWLVKQLANPARTRVPDEPNPSVRMAKLSRLRRAAH